MLKRLAARLVSFRPHIHTASCVICESAVNTQRQPSKPVDQVQCTFSLDQNRTEKFPSTSMSSGEENNLFGLTVEESRLAGLKKWLLLVTQLNEEQKQTSSTSHTEAKRLYDTYIENPTEATQETVEGAARYLDTFCKRPGAAAASPTETIVSFPANFTIPYHTIQKPDADVTQLADRNDFLARVKEKNLTSKELAHQVRFQAALLDFQRILVNDTHLPFFLCCGTALGARREGYFIPHDDDIDVGVLYKDTVLYGAADAHDVERFAADPYSPHCTAKASTCVSQLLANLTFGGQFVVFDVCGTVDKGLEVRLLHAATGVRLDVNWYYPPLPDTADASLVAQRGHFLWSATYYEQAGQRRHGMYRYLHNSLSEKTNALERLFFCGRCKDDKSLYFSTPKEDYLVECFGDDWRIPKVYSYAEGLEGEFTNIIKE